MKRSANSSTFQDILGNKSYKFRS